MVDNTDTLSIANGKTGAVEQWNAAVNDLPDDEDQKPFLQQADIHNETERMGIEEVIEHEISEENYLILHDAFDDLKQAFDW